MLNEHVKPKAENLFHQIAFYSPAISDFYPPQLAIKPNNGNSGKFDLSIKLRESNETTRRIDISECQMILGFYYLNKLKQQNSDLLHAIPYITFEFKNAIGIEELKEYYLRLYNFLVFINFNKSVPIEKIKLYVKKENNIREIGNAYINSKYNNFESKQHKAIYAQALTNKEISDLFIQVSDNNDIKKHYYIPDNKKDIHRFNHSDLLLCATCFEGIFKQNYPNFKANENETFAKVKNDFLQFANDYRDTKELTKSEKKYADKLHDQIYHYDGRLEEIFNFALKEYRFVISDALTRCKSLFKIRDNENLGSIYADIRNHFAHGTFFVLGDKECFVYSILQILIYTINLKVANIPDDKAKDMIEKTFL